MNKQLIVRGPFHELEELKLFLIAELESDNHAYAETLRRTIIYSTPPTFGHEEQLGQFEVFEFAVGILGNLVASAMYDLIKGKIELFKAKSKSELELSEEEERRPKRGRKRK